VTEVIVRAAWAAAAIVIVVAGEEATLKPALAALVAVTVQVPALVSDNAVPVTEQPAGAAVVTEYVPPQCRIHRS